MLRLPYDQIVHIQASLAFANLAAKEKRPRRHRGAGYRASLIPTANTTAQRVPLGTPMRPISNTPFSHIQIIPKVSTKESIDDKRSPQPMFQKPSLTYDAEAIANSSETLPAKPRDSIANNTQGTTFAAKARAAELQAARARKLLKENEKQSAAGTLSVPHEVMTFSKSRARGGKTWKPLNLDDLTEAPASDGDIGPNHINGVSTVTDQTCYGNREYDCENSGIDSNFFHDHSDLFLGQQLEASTTFDFNSGSSPNSKTITQPVATYDAGKWDLDLLTKDEAFPQASNTQMTHRHKQTLPSTPALYPVPVLTSASDQMQKEAQYLRQKQEAQLRTLQEHLLLERSEVREEQAGMDLRSYKSAAPVSDLLSQDQSTLRRMAESVITDTDGDPFGASPSSIPQPSLAQYRNSSNVTQGPQLPYNLLGPAPRQFAPYQYPAVKGTMSDIPRSTQMRTLTRNPSVPQRQDYFADGAAGVTHPHTSIAQAPQTPYRKLSAEEKKGMLLQQLHAVVDESNSGAGAKSGRTVLHDPFVYHEHQQSESKLGIASTTNAEQDLVMASEPLPWTKRPVDYISAPPLANIENAADVTQQLTPIGTRPIREGDSESHLPRYAAAASIADAESWWRKDSRANTISRNQIIDFMNHAAEQSRKAKSTEFNDHRSGKPTEWSGSSLSTTTPERLLGRAVVSHLLLPILANLESYLIPGGYFNKHGHVPEWCIDQGTGGQTSFFGEDWGAPPPRVGRDPRYQPVLHEGTRTVYETFGGRWGSDGIARRYR